MVLAPTVDEKEEEEKEKRNPLIKGEILDERVSSYLLKSS